MSITAIPQSDVHRITSSQVITDLTTAVKELVENSLDAHSTAIDIIFNNYGLISVEVSDNGDGISSEDFNGIGLKHHTSKISNFEDISRVKTLGFRGEAINSLCSLGNIKITTTKTAPKANALEFNTDGSISSNKICSRQQGTTVTISDLFHSFPVRKKDFVKNHKKEFTKCIAILQAYCIINTGVKFSIFNITNKNKKQLVLKTQGSAQMKDNLLNIFGSNGSFGLIPIDTTLDLNEFKALSSFKMDSSVSLDYVINIQGLISKNSNGFGRVTNDRQYLYINSRPISFTKLNRLITEVYKFYNLNQFPCFVLDIKINPSFFDVNVTPDKRTILLHNENKVFEVLKAELVDFFDGLDYNLSKNTNSTQKSFSQSRLSHYNDEKDEELEEQEDDEFVKEKGEKLSRDFSLTQENSLATSQTTKDIELIDFSKIQNIPPEYEEADLDIESDAAQEDDTHQQEEGEDEQEEEEDEPTLLSTYQPTQDMLLYQPSQELFVQDPDMESPQLTQQEQEELDALEPLEEDPDISDIPSDEYEDQEHQTNFGQKRKITLSDLNSSVPVKKSRLIQSTLPIPHIAKKIKSIHDLGSFRNPGGEYMTQSLQKRSKQQTLDSVIISCDGEVTEEETVLLRDGTLNFVNTERDQDHDQDSDSEHDHSGCHHESLDSEDQDQEEKEEDLEIISVTQAPKPARTEHTLNLQTMSTLPDRLLAYDDILEHSIKPSQGSSQKQKVEIDDIANQQISEQLLTLTVSKKDFLDMKIIGQFNLGFILVMRDNKDLFIIDQHASDEKYNFEDLNKTTTFQSQYLIKGKVLELTVLDELTLIENQEVFDKNGFKFKINEDQQPGSRIELISLPVSKKTIFDVSDLHELIHLIKENPGTQTSSIRCSKIRSMLAMRACRKSIMVGKPLNMKTMTRVVRNLAGLEKPWNCPHGRPTMRHLMELKQWQTFNEDYKV
ncbi:hypothetical protein WICPIJ_000577 [Wickerhamomyces pijperi]|uniref:DNA mismatch repair protein PMS1 n=1 Tax=Wickerhamomyces pijperi TaxID=599730 RepID=A0A9P8QDC7_WICPI|nr:hypothetical protein WICPIJ_000577 [Wickerhamomyces pijperi]